MPTFSKDFIWGTATSSYQIEGGKDQRGPCIWDEFCRVPGKIENNDIGDLGCGHYEKWSEDVALLEKLGAPNYRFSISWPRILSDGVQEINQKGVDFYNKLIDRLLEKGIAPWVTSYHWDMPSGLMRNGGWLNRDSTNWFAAYNEKLAQLFGDRVNNWFVFNEPSVASYFGYAVGSHAPGISGRETYLMAAHNINRAIGAGYRAIKSICPKSRVGSAYTLSPGRSCGSNAEQVAELASNTWNWTHMDPALKGSYPKNVAAAFEPFVKGNDLEEAKVPLDIVGVQFYAPNYWREDATKPLGADFCDAPNTFDLTDIGWPIDPQAFTDVLLEFSRRYKGVPLLVSENGMCDNTQPIAGKVKDLRRIKYLQDHITAVYEAMKEGAPIKGYFCWSFMDNFEWGYGYSKRFGLVYVDYENDYKRIEKDSFAFFGNVVQNNGF